MRSAADVMSHPVVSIARDTPARVALVLLLEHGFAVLPVVLDGRVVGTVSEKDLLRLSMGGHSAPVSAGEVMAPTTTAPTTASIAELTVTMLVTGLPSVPIVDGDDRLVGMVSRVDLLWTLVPANHGLRRTQRHSALR